MLSERWLAGTLTDRRFSAAVADLQDLDVDRYPVPPFVRRAYDLRANVTAYDAAHAALARPWVASCGRGQAAGQCARPGRSSARAMC